MAEHNEADKKERKSNGNAEVWKWIAGVLMGALIGTWTGEFMPNRNIATTDQVAKVETGLSTLTSTVSSLTAEVNEMKGELNMQNQLMNGRSHRNDQ